LRVQPPSTYAMILIAKHLSSSPGRALIRPNLVGTIATRTQRYLISFGTYSPQLAAFFWSASFLPPIPRSLLRGFFISSIFGDCSSRSPYYDNPATGFVQFFDSPSDPCLLNPDGKAGIAWATNAPVLGGISTVRARCNEPNPTAGALMFTTELVGVITANVDAPLPDTFTWTDTFNGVLPPPPPLVPGMGGISTPGTDIAVDPNSGAGGITIDSVNGAPVPEPPTGILFLLGVFCLCCIVHRRHAL
jgi:hypothetical protein